ncbi:MAG TPA: GNAT family N-acetyltransferase [Ktedonobacterales bacterium]
MAGGESVRIHTPRHLTLIQTERLLLRPFTEADAERLHALFDTHPDVWRYDGRFPRGLEQRRALLRWRMLDFEREGWGAMGVVIRASGELIGQAGLQYWLCPQADGTALPEVELFYKLGRDYWGQGYATEAGRVLLAYAFDHLRLRRVVSTAARANEHSVALMRRLGMRISDDPSQPDEVLGTLERPRAAED